ncbi:unnamed protein product [Microthlaspi erraticum]|uniref:Uncharacterized protein n=1 Tax=Microthlaspi erraticum TaxID=1685480 RepID=A0A6D2KGF7_9BRAS|nr:unnamed protein product [Microthlaspi erraticum]
MFTVQEIDRRAPSGRPRCNQMADKTKSRHRRELRMEMTSWSFITHFQRKITKRTSQTQGWPRNLFWSHIDHFVKDLSIHSFECSQTSPEA